MMSDRLDNVGTINWQLAICLLIAWLLIFLFLFKGVKSAGKVNALKFLQQRYY